MPHAKGGRADKFTFFETDSRIAGDFQTVHDLNMCIEALFKTLAFFDMLDVFQIISATNISLLGDKLEALFAYQTVLQSVEAELAIKPLTTILLIR